MTDSAALYERHREELLLFLVRRTADPEIALDIWAETFAQAVANQRKHRGSTPEEAAGWLYGIARRQLALFYRRGTAEQKAMHRLKLERPPASPELLSELVERAGLDELKDALKQALSELSPSVRDAVQLRVVDELGYPDLAQRLGITEQAARARVSRGLSKLADLLDRTPVTT